MPIKSLRPLRGQRGASLLGMAVLAVVVAFLMLMAARIFPVVSEFLTVRRAVSQIMQNAPTTALEIRTAFDRQKAVEYSIKSISGKDIDVQQVGDKLRASYAYNVEVEIVEPVYLLIKFSGGATAGSGGP